MARHVCQDTRLVLVWCQMKGLAVFGGHIPSDEDLPSGY